MVNEKTKNPALPIPEGTRRSSTLETIHHRGRKRSLSSISSSAKGVLNQQSGSKEEADANRLLLKHGTSRPTSSSRQIEEIPDLSQKEMSRLVGAIIKRQKRDASSVGRKLTTTRERSVPSTATPLFPEKCPDSARNQTHKVEMPARSAASTKEEAIQMLRESRTDADRAANPEIDLHRHLDLAEELINRAPPR